MSNSVNDLRISLEDYIDSNDDKTQTIRGFETTKTNQNFANIKLIPSIENTLLLKNKYEVIEILSDYTGSLKDLIQFQNKKLPSAIPFISVLTVGGGSSGGWRKKESDDSSYDEYIMDSCGGCKDFQVITNIELEKCYIDVKIGKGGLFKNYQQSDGIVSTAPTIEDINCNPGGNTICSIGHKLSEANPIDYQVVSTGLGGSYNTVNSLRSKYKDIEIDKLDTKELLFKDNKMSDNSFNFVKKSNLYINHNYINCGGLSIDLKAQIRHVLSNLYFSEYYLSNNYYSFDNGNINNFFNTFKDNYSKIPTSKYTINNYGIYLTAKSTSSHNASKAVFFSGLDGVNYGDAGTPGDLTFIKSNSNAYFYHLGSCGAGKDGVCYIYYPSEV